MSEAGARPRVVRRVIASVPGKLILAGEHAVVYGRPALVAAIDLRLEAAFAGPLAPAATGPSVLLDAPALGPPREIPWRQAIDHARSARRDWQRYARDPGARRFPAEHRGEPAHVVLTALGEAAMFLGEESGPPIELAIHGDLPVGRGLGSSAAAAVAILAGYLALRNAPGDHNDLAHLALEVERRQHGLPSGVDAATVIQGGLVEARPRSTGGFELRPLAVTPARLARFAVYDTGRPPESTGEVVAAVRARLDDSTAFASALDRIEDATEALQRSLTGTAADAGAGGDPREAIAACQRGLEELGVVPARIAALVRKVESAGGAAKISGAGSLAGPGAGTLIVYHPEPEALAGVAELTALRRLAVVLGAPGLQLKSPPRGVLARNDPARNDRARERR